MPRRQENEANRETRGQAQEARNAFAERQLQTPLLGEDQLDKLQGTGYEGSAPRTNTRLVFFYAASFFLSF